MVPTYLCWDTTTMTSQLSYDYDMIWGVDHSNDHVVISLSVLRTYLEQQ